MTTTRKPNTPKNPVNIQEVLEQIGTNTVNAPTAVENPGNPGNVNGNTSEPAHEPTPEEILKEQIANLQKALAEKQSQLVSESRGRSFVEWCMERVEEMEFLNETDIPFDIQIKIIPAEGRFEFLSKLVTKLPSGATKDTTKKGRFSWTNHWYNSTGNDKVVVPMSGEKSIDAEKVKMHLIVLATAGKLAKDLVPTWDYCHNSEDRKDYLAKNVGLEFRKPAEETKK